MDMKSIKQWISLLLVSVFLLGALAGCNSSDDGSNQPSSGQSGISQEESAEKSTPEEVSDPGGDVTSFNIATVRYTDTWPIDFLKEGFMKEIEEKHGLDLNWQVYYSSDWSEQKSLLLASGDLPDAFMGSITLNASDVSQNKSFFVDLTDLIGDNMPNLTAAFEDEPQLKAIATDREGKIFSLPKKLPKRPEVCGTVAYINQEWLDNLGLDTPTTYLELEAVLEAFIREDADGDGDPNNEIGLTGSAGDYVLSNDLRNILRPFATMVSRENNYMGIDGNGTPVFMPVQENYKEAVKWMRGLYEKGIIDPEYFTQESTMATAKRKTEGGSQVGLVYGWTEDAEVSTNVDQFALLEEVAGPDGNHYVENGSNTLDISDREFMITTNCSDPAKLLQWADEFYTDLSSLQTFYGSIPQQVADNGDGTYSVLKPSDGTSLDTSAWSNSLRDFGPKYMSPSFYDKISLPEDQGDGIKLADDIVNAKYVTTDKNIGFPLVQYTEDELGQIATLGIDINKYCEVQYAHWVVNGGIEEEWDAYLAQLETMNLPALVGIYEDAYEYYLQSMES